jgi:hypothetical protein
MHFNVGQKRHKRSDVTMGTRGSSLLWGKNDLKALLASGIEDPMITFIQIARFSLNLVGR